MKKEMLLEILSYIKDAYVDLNEPKYFFLERGNEEADKLINEVSRFFGLIEDTDFNEDVSRGFIISKDKTSIVLRVSLVGPYYFLLQLSGAFDEFKEVESKIDNLAGIFHFRKIAIEDLTVILPVKFAEEDYSIYQALFSYSGFAPF